MPKAFETYLQGPLRYLIGTDVPVSNDGILECGYDNHTGTIAYCNLFDEKNNGQYGPYLHNSDTAASYDEGQIDPSGPGWRKNLDQQFRRRQSQGFSYCELDNPDAYSSAAVIGAVRLAGTYGLRVIAKNPSICDDPLSFVRHPNVYGIIVEKDCGSVPHVQDLRIRAGKPTLPVWFVSFGNGKPWALSIASVIKDNQLTNMGVTYSNKGEYASSEDILVPLLPKVSSALV